MNWVWIGFFVQLLGRIWDASFHSAIPVDDTIPLAHYVELLGTLLVAVVVLRLNGLIYHLIFASACLKVVGWLWDNLFIHLRGIADPAEFTAPHIMLLVGGLLQFVYCIAALFVEKREAPRDPVQRKISLVFLALVIGIALTEMDQMIVATSMLSIVGDLGQFSLYGWVFSVYLFTSTIMIPISGKLAELMGRKVTYLLSLSIFILGSVLCGLSQDMMALVIFRGIQGIGAGLFYIIPMTIIADMAVGNQQLARMQGLLGVVVGMSLIFGPLLGGVITDYLSWHWVFFINVPLGLLSIVLLFMAYDEQRERTPTQIDWVGVILVSAANLAILLAFTLLNDGENWWSLGILGLLIVGIVLFIVFGLHLARVKVPLVPLLLFRTRLVSIASLLTFLTAACLYSVTIVVPLFLQTVLGVSPTRSGAFLGVTIVSFIISNSLIGPILAKVNYRLLILVSLAFTGVSLFLLNQMSAATDVNWIITYLLLFGVGIGFLNPLMTIILQTSVQREHQDLSIVLLLYFRHMGGVIGLSIVGFILINQMGSVISLTEIQLTLAKQELFEPLIQKLLSQSINTTFAACLVFILLSFGVCFFLKKEDRLPG